VVTDVTALFDGTADQIEHRDPAIRAVRSWTTHYRGVR
jgi:hypothetical protein